MAQNERDCKEFKFKQLIKLEVDKWTGPLQNRVQRLAVAPGYGLAFVASNLGFKALKVVDIIKKDIENPNCANEVIKDFQYVADIDLQLKPDDLSVSNDSQFLSVCVTNNGFVFALIYSVNSFIQGNPVKDLVRVKLSAGDGELMQLMWNPGADYPSVFASAVNDGTLSLWQVKDNSFSQQARISGTAVKCLCWSPKGKQLVVGRNDGRLIQYDQNLVEKKVIPGPADLFNGQPFTAVDVVWESTYVFFVAYLLLGSDHEQPHLVHVVSQKGKEPVYIDLEDPCFGGGEGRAPRYYSTLVPEWKLLLLASASSLEAAVLGKSLTDEAYWERWILDDAARAEIPMTQDYEEVFPMGFAVDFSSNMQVPIGDNQFLAPCPVLLMLGTNGTLICYYMLHSSAQSIQKKPAEEFSVRKTITGEPVATSPVKPVTTGQESSGQSTSQTKQPDPLAVSTNTHKVPATAGPSATIRQMLPEQSATSSPVQGKQSMFDVSQSSTPVTQFGVSQSSTPVTQFGVSQGSTPGQVTQFGGTMGSSSAPSGQVQPLLGGRTTPTSTPSQVKPPSFGTPTPFAQSVSSAPNQQKPPTIGLTTALPKAPAAGNTFSFGGTKAEQTQKPGVFGTGENRSMGGQVPAGNRVLPVQKVSAEASVATRALTRHPTIHPTSITSSSTQGTQDRQQVISKTSTRDVTQEGPGKQPTSVSPTKRSASREEDGGGRGASSGQGRPGSGQDPFMKTLIEEMQHFQQELNEFKRRGSGLSEAVGSKEEMTNIHRVTETVVSFCEDMKSTTQSINNEIHALKTECLEEFATLEECRAREERNQNPNYRHLLGARSLDPVSERKMRGIRSQAHYLDTGIQDIHSKLDLEWEEYQRKRRNGRKLKCPTTDTIYRTLKNNKHVISNQQTAIENMCTGIGKPHLSKIKPTRLSVTSPATENNQWPSGRGSGYQPRSLLGANPTLRSANVTPQRGSGSPQRAMGVSPEKQSKLRDLLGSRAVTPVKSTAPVNLTMSRFWSSDLQLDESIILARSPLQSGGNSKLKEVSTNPFSAHKTPTIKSPDSLRPQMRANTSTNKENQRSKLSFTGSPNKPTESKTPAFSFSKGSAEFGGFGNKPSQTSKESSSVMLGINAATKPAPSFAFSKTSTPVTKSGSGHTGLNVTAKPDTTFSFNKGLPQGELSAVSKPGGLSTTSTNFTTPSVGFNFNKPATEKSQTTNKTSGSGGTFTFGTKTADSFTFNKPDLTKTAESKTSNKTPTLDKTPKLLESKENSATVDINPRSRPGTDMSGSFNFPVQATGDGKDATSRAVPTPTATFSGFGSASVQPVYTTVLPDSSSDAVPAKFEVGQKHLQFGSALAEVLAEESTPAPASVGIFGQPTQQLSTPAPASVGIFGQPTQQLSNESPTSLFNSSSKRVQHSERPSEPKSSQPSDLVVDSLTKDDQIREKRPSPAQGLEKSDALTSAVSIGTTDLNKEPPARPDTTQTGNAGITFGSTGVNLSEKAKSSVSMQALTGDKIAADSSKRDHVSQGGAEGSSSLPPAMMSIVTSTTDSTDTVNKKASRESTLSTLLTGGQQQQASGQSDGQQPASSGFSFTPSGEQQSAPSTIVTTGANPQLTTTIAQSTGQQVSTGTGFSLGTAHPGTTSSNTQNESKPQTASTGFSFGSAGSGTTQQPLSTAGFSFGSAQSSTTEKTVTVDPSTTQSTNPQPASTNQQLGSGTQQITSTTQQTTSTNQQPGSTTQQITSTTQQIGSGSQQITSTTQQPESGTQQPTSTTQQPTSTTQQSVAGTQQTTSTTQQTPTTTQQPGSATGFGGFAAPQSVAGNQQPPTTGGFGTSFGSQQTPSSAGFSFATGGSSGSQPALFGFGQQTLAQPQGSGDGMKGMESEGGNSTAQDASLFGGGGGLFGLGGKPSAENAKKNVFAGSFNTGNTASENQGGSLFGSQQNSTGTSFGGGFGGTNLSSPFQGSSGSSSQGGLFSNTQGGVSSTGFGTGPQQTTPQKASAFGGAPVFGSGMAASGFGSPPSFGSTPAFGGSAFGNNAATAPMFGSSSVQNSAGFSSFANSSAPSFGNLAQQNTPTFGGTPQDSGGFGAAPNNFQGFGNNNPNAAFGTGPKMASPSFSSYRS